MQIALNIATDDDDTADIVIEALERFARGDLADILSSHDPLVKVSVCDSEGMVIWC